MKLKQRKRININKTIQGIAMVELIITIAISSIVLVMGTTVFIFSQTIYNQSILDSQTTYVVENLVDYLESNMSSKTLLYLDNETGRICLHDKDKSSDPDTFEDTVVYENSNNYILSVTQDDQEISVSSETSYLQSTVTIEYLYSKKRSYIEVTKLFII